MLEPHNLIIGGDLKLYLIFVGGVGGRPRQDQHEGLFLNWIEKHKLVDIEPTKISQTWRNGRERTGCRG
jgi:hypothetical protein